MQSEAKAEKNEVFCGSLVPRYRHEHASLNRKDITDAKVHQCTFDAFPSFVMGKNTSLTLESRRTV